jgi:hypothetical protein
LSKFFGTSIEINKNNCTLIEKNMQRGKVRR